MNDLRDEDPLDLGGGFTCFADWVTLERHGGVTHLLFTTEQNFDGRPRRVMGGRVIVPTELLALLGERLLKPIQGAKLDHASAVH